MSNERLSMTVTFGNLTDAQAIALDAMFRLWQSMGSAGSSRWTKFYADGDGNFRPKLLNTDFSRNPYPNHIDAEALRKVARISRDNEIQAFEAEPAFDFDPVAWELHP